MASGRGRFLLQRRRGTRAPLLAALLLALAPPWLAVELAPTPSPEVLRARRERFLARLPARSVAVLHSAPERVMSHDTAYLYRQDSDFYYLTGIEEPDTTAVLRNEPADGKRYVLFVRPRDPRRESYEGPRPGPQGAAARYGADAAFADSELSSRLASWDPVTYRFSGYLAEAERLELSDGNDRAWAEKFRAAYRSVRDRDAGPAAVADAGEILHGMRLVKDEEEIRMLRRAAEISAQGHVLAMKAAAPGKWEFEIQQALEGYCFANGARRMAYPSIVGSGPDSVFLHWDKNNRRMEAGEVVLNDSGAEYGYYATDITRTYPVSGRFSAEQRAIYEIVLDAQKQALALVKPGARHGEIEEKCARVQTEGLLRLGLLSGDADRILKERAYRRFTLHGVSHWVGLDVHDRGRDEVGGSSRVLEPGMVFTIEPGIYVPSNAPGVDPKWWNIGVRIEDTILVTRDGSECLSCSAPREIADVEKTVLSGRQ
ncbi:MAG: aminopeptidase P N-terminal domain-containing protein [Acidobacteriota bacterium]